MGPRSGRRLLAAGCGAVLVLLGGAAHGELGSPLPVRNLSPAAALYGVPRMFGALPVRRFEATVMLEHVNNFSGDYNDHMSISYDGTTSVTSLALRGAVSGAFEWGLEVPYVHHDGGFTDGLIDGFHELFGFPDAGRDDVPRDRLHYRLEFDGETLADVDDSVGHLGDVRGWLGYRVFQGAARQGVVRAMVKAPTGSLETLSGSGGTDVAVWGEWVDDAILAGLGARLTAGAGILVPGNGDLPSAAQQDTVFTGHLGVQFPVADWLTLRGQLDAHSEVLDTGLRQAADGAVQGTLGATVGIGAAGWFDLGLSEDLTNASAPDVVFLLRFGVAM